MKNWKESHLVHSLAQRQELHYSQHLSLNLQWQRFFNPSRPATSVLNYLSVKILAFFFFSLILNINLPSCKQSCYFLSHPEQTLVFTLPFSDTLCIFEHSSESFLKHSFGWTVWIYSKLLGEPCFPAGYSHWSFVALLQLSKTCLKYSHQNWTKYSHLDFIGFKYSGHITSYVLLIILIFKHCAWLLDSSTTLLIVIQDGYQYSLIFHYKFVILHPAFCILLFQPSSLWNISHLCP